MLGGFRFCPEAAIAFGALSGSSPQCSAASGFAPKRPLLRGSTKPTAAIQACRWKRSPEADLAAILTMAWWGNAIISAASVGPYQGGPSPDESHGSDAFIEAARLHDL